MITVHLIFNAHIDPVWLWPWQAGLDEAIATCRSACDRLDAHPDLRFSRGEAWVYREVELADPALFERIRAHVASGRWEIVNGWWLQPDCNLPSRRGMEQQIALGNAYFEDRFGPGAFPRIAFNVDSFGHAAALPELMRAAGQDRYVMMRPQEHEMALPARLFRWRGYEGGPEVTTFRIARGYTTRHIDRAHIEASLTHLPAGVTDTMCFVGVGDHGGGPTEEQIAWCRENAEAFPGCRLVFSSPSRFFAAVEKHVPDLPLVTGELQQHAVGCYSVYRPIKTATRRAEHLLEMAEGVAGPGTAEAARVTEGWERVCFAHFHDTIGGTCLPSAYQQVLDQVGGAAAAADEILQRDLRRRLNALPDDPLQRIVAFNAAGADFAGYVEFEPWLEWQRWQPSWHLLDEQGNAVPYQAIHSEALTHGLSRLLFRAEIPAGELRTFRIAKGGDVPATTAALAAPVRADSGAITTGRGGITLAQTGIMYGGGGLALPQLHLLPDVSDTWSHRLDRYAEGPPETPQWNAPVAIDAGPLMGSWVQTGRVGASPLRAEWRLYAGEPYLELLLTVHWCETQRILKLVLPLRDGGDSRVDGTMGGSTARPNDGREMPLREWTRVPTTYRENAVGVVCPDVFALDATPARVRLTLLRASYLAHHDPYPAGLSPRGVVSDQGVHHFRFRLFYGPEASPELLDAHARMLQRPPLFADLTRGMPTALTSGVG